MTEEQEEGAREHERGYNHGDGRFDEVEKDTKMCKMRAQDLFLGEAIAGV